MKKYMQRLLAVCVAGLLWTASVPSNAADSPAVHITVYHTNDMHGALAGTEKCIGVDKIAALKDQTENAILVDAGDATQGLPLASLSKGKDIIDIMNAAGYDVMAAGNHEFDYGTAQLLANASGAAFPILASNLYSKSSGQPLLSGYPAGNSGCHTVIEKGGVKIGFFGLTTNDTKTATNPSGIVDVDFKDEIETAQKEIDELEKEDVDAVIAIAHLGEYTNVPCDSSKLAEAMTGNYAGKLDAVIDGHSHTVEQNKVVNDVLIQQTGTGLENLGKIELTVTEGTLDKIEGSMLSYNEISIEPKTVVAEKINAIKAEQDKTLSNPLCKVKDTLWGGYVNHVAVARITVTNLGDFTADAYKDAAVRFIKSSQDLWDNYKDLPVAAVDNGGGIRASLESGERTIGDLLTVFPFSNTLMMKKVTPKIMYEMLENSVSSITGQDASTGKLEGQPNGGFLQVSGFTFAYNPAAETGSKVEHIYLEGRQDPLDRNDDSSGIMLVSNSFIMSGGNNYTMLGNQLPLVGEIGGEFEVMQAYISQCTNNGQNPLDTGKIPERIKVNGSYTAGSYEASVKVISAAESSGEPKAQVNVIKLRIIT